MKCITKKKIESWEIQFIVVSSFFLQDYISFIFSLVFFGPAAWLPYGGCTFGFLAFWFHGSFGQASLLSHYILLIFLAFSFSSLLHNG
jgi:hypothetical protein